MSTDDQTDPRGVQGNRPEDVDALASTVISVLRGRQSVSSEGLRQFVLDHMLRAVLAKGAFAPEEFLHELRGYRLTVGLIVDRYVPKVARMLGELWESDGINFADVTIGIMRLQALLTEASVLAEADRSASEHAVHALVLVPQGEQHFLGASVVACHIRRMGHEASISYDEDMGTLTARLMQDVPDVVMITCARRETLESAAKTVQTIRNAVSEPPLVAIGGAFVMERDAVIDMTGADIVTDGVDEVMALCVKRARPQGRP